MKQTLFYLAVFGWLCSIAVHSTAVMGMDAQSLFPYYLFLHIAIFFVFAPALFMNRNNPKFLAYKEEQGKTLFPDPRKFIEILFEYVPNWMRFLALGGFVYAFFNFILFAMHSEGTSVEQIGDTYQLFNRGNLLREITEKEYGIIP